MLPLELVASVMPSLINRKTSPGLAAQVALFVLGAGEESDGQTGDIDFFELPVAQVKRAGQTRIRDLQGAIVVVPDGIDHGNVLAIDGSFGEREVYRLEHACGRGLFDGV